MRYGDACPRTQTSHEGPSNDDPISIEVPRFRKSDQVIAGSFSPLTFPLHVSESDLFSGCARCHFAHAFTRKFVLILVSYFLLPYIDKRL